MLVLGDAGASAYHVERDSLTGEVFGVLAGDPMYSRSDTVLCLPRALEVRPKMF